MLQNLHTHVNLCDGKNTPEQMIERAIDLGFDSLGFSSHAKTSQRLDWELKCSPAEYWKKINELKELYSGKIKIFIGAELDYYSEGVMPTDELDYTIGSVHMVERAGTLVSFDHSYELSKGFIHDVYGGDALSYVRDYYEQVVRMSKEVRYDVVGHFDLLTKFSEKDPDMIDINSKAYRDFALEALHAVRESKDLFEVNTGAISRGYRTSPYPAPFILDEMRSLGCKLIISSDCHNKDFLDFRFKEAKEYVSAHGFDVLYYLTESGFVGEKIL